MQNAKPTAKNAGTANGLARLDEDKVRDIRRRAAAGESFRDLGFELMVSANTIRAVVTRATWKHVE